MRREESSCSVPFSTARPHKRASTFLRGCPTSRLRHRYSYTQLHLPQGEDGRKRVPYVPPAIRLPLYSMRTIGRGTPHWRQRHQRLQSPRSIATTVCQQSAVQEHFPHPRQAARQQPILPGAGETGNRRRKNDSIVIAARLPSLRSSFGTPAGLIQENPGKQKWNGC